jgi:16S rRNA (uracil1498-N3)-methyltransferase
LIVQRSSFIVHRSAMRHRIFVDALAPTVTVTGDEFHHSVRVVRVRAGEEVEVFDKAGKVARGTVESLERDQAVIRVDEELPSRESKLAIHLAMSIIQLEKFELVLQKATELGVKSFIPLVTGRIELRRERYAGKLERWNKIVFEAVKQSGRSAVPAIEEPKAFEEVIARPGIKLLFDADQPASQWPPSLDAVTIFIGPEGGWSDDELAAARSHGCVFARMGPRRLRAETAAIVACAVVAARSGDI